MLNRRSKTKFCSVVLIVISLGLIVLMRYVNSSSQTHQERVVRDIGRSKISQDSECCNGTLGYATNNAQFSVTCSKMKCCNGSETVAVIPVEVALGFRFRCMPKTHIRPVCYQPGTEVRSSNQDPDHIPRACCDGAKFELELNKWYAAMSVKCVLR